MKTVNVIVERNPFQVSTKPGSRANFIVNEPEVDLKSVVGYGPTLDLALNAFEVMYEARYDEEIKAVVIQKTIISK